MPISLDDYLSKLPDEERQAIKARSGVLIAEEATLRELREACARSQQEIAQKLGVQQAAVSRLERRTDMYLSTLRNLIRVMGGDLEIIARFPDRPPVRISQFTSLEAEVIPKS